MPRLLLALNANLKDFPGGAQEGVWGIRTAWDNRYCESRLEPAMDWESEGMRVVAVLRDMPDPVSGSDIHQLFEEVKGWKGFSKLYNALQVVETVPAMRRGAGLTGRFGFFTRIVTEGSPQEQLGPVVCGLPPPPNLKPAQEVVLRIHTLRRPQLWHREIEVALSILREPKDQIIWSLIQAVKRATEVVPSEPTLF